MQNNYKNKAIQKAKKEVDKGIFISQEKAFAWLDSWGKQNELPAPEPDIFPKK